MKSQDKYKYRNTIISSQKVVVVKGRFILEFTSLISFFCRFMVLELSLKSMGICPVDG